MVTADPLTLSLRFAATPEYYQKHESLRNLCHVNKTIEQMIAIVKIYRPCRGIALPGGAKMHRMTKPLDTEMREYLEGSRGRWPAIAEQAGVSYSWITKFAQNRIPRPAYATLVKLQLTQTAANKRKRAAA